MILYLHHNSRALNQIQRLQNQRENKVIPCVPTYSRCLILNTYTLLKDEFIANIKNEQI